MKKSDVYPSASEEDLKNLPPQVRFLGLHPLVWVAVVVAVISAGRACDTVEELHCQWKWWKASEGEPAAHMKSDVDEESGKKSGKKSDKESD